MSAKPQIQERTLQTAALLARTSTFDVICAKKSLPTWSKQSTSARKHGHSNRRPASHTACWPSLQTPPFFKLSPPPISEAYTRPCSFPQAFAFLPFRSTSLRSFPFFTRTAQVYSRYPQTRRVLPFFSHFFSTAPYSLFIDGRLTALGGYPRAA